MRQKEVKLSSDEHRLLNKLKKSEYHAHTPYGFIVRDLVEGALEE